jgi:hypothetical protein
MKGLYEVTAIKARRIKTATGFMTPPDGYIAHKCFQVARSEEEAIDLARMYMPPAVRHLPIRATWLRASE